MTDAPQGKLTIRQATLADVPQISLIRAADLEFGPADPRMALYLDGRHHPQHALPPRVAYLATMDGEVAGYIAGHLTRRFDCHGELQYLYVTPKHRRGGVASALLRHLADWFVEQNALRVCVDVNADSPAAEPFYTRHGAKPLRPHWMVWGNIQRLLR